MIEGLGSVWLEVKDLERSLTFYCDGLRFDLERREDGEHPTVVLRAGDLEIVLTQRKGASRRPGPVQLAMQVTGVQAYFDALVARGIRPVRSRDGQDTRSFTVRDPDGVIWRFEQSPT